MKKRDRAVRVDRQVSIMLFTLMLICFILSLSITRSIFLRYAQDQLSSSAESVFDFLSRQKLNLQLVEAGIDSQETFTLTEEISSSLLSAAMLSPANHIYLARTDRIGNVSYFTTDSENVSYFTTGSETVNGKQSGLEYSEEFICQAATAKEPVSTSISVNSGNSRLFGFYYPVISDDGNLLAVVAIEFSGASYMEALKASFLIHFIIMLILWSMAALWSYTKFKSISNLGYRSVYNIDQMTGFKNRNAFDIDLANIISTNSFESLTIYYVDVNDLKIVNDNEGHEAGDMYLKTMSELIAESMGAGDVLYRVGGDEFCILSFSHVRSKAKTALKRFEQNIQKYNEANDTSYSAAIGFAVYNFELDADASATRARAEIRMYENKKRMKNGLGQLAEEGFLNQNGFTQNS